MYTFTSGSILLLISSGIKAFQADQVQISLISQVNQPHGLLNPFHGVQQKPSLSFLLSPIVFTVGKVDLFSWRWWPKLGRRECDGGAWLVISRLAPYGAHDSPARSYARMLARMLRNLAQQFMGLSVQRKTRVLICAELDWIYGSHRITQNHIDLREG